MALDQTLMPGSADNADNRLTPQQDSPEQLLHALLQQSVSITGGAINAPIIGGISGGQVTFQTEEQAYDVRGLPNPYLGLRSYSYADRERYAGRRATISAAVQLLATSGEQRTILFITGASGSGKSSFAQAGLIPALEHHYSELGQPVRWAVFRPSRYPLAGLTDVLPRFGLTGGTPILEAVLAKPERLGRFIQHTTLPRQVNLLVIDQFEELFTQSDMAQRDALFTFLERLPVFAELRTHVILTLRSDYLPELFGHKALYDLAKQGVDLRVMNEVELQEAIQLPLQQRYPNTGKRFEDALLERLAHDAAEDSAYLPLLQVTLEELWTGGMLKLAAYALPGIQDSLAHAIQQRAEDVYAYSSYDGGHAMPRTATDRATILAIFLDLIDVSLDDDSRKDVRRRRTYVELHQGSADRARLIEDLANARLLSRTAEKRDDGRETDVVDIIHEALIRNWGRLRQTITEQRQVLQQRARLEQGLREWLTHERIDEYLLSGVRLAEAQDLDRRGDITLANATAQELLRGSVIQHEAAQQRELEQAHALADARAKVVRRTRRFAIGLAVLLIAAIGVSFFAFQQWNISQDALSAKSVAEQQALDRLNFSEAQRLALAARDQIRDAPATALLLAAEAAKRNINPVTEQALRDMLAENIFMRSSVISQTGEVWSAAFSPDGQMVASGGEQGTFLWSLDGKKLATFGDGSAIRVAFSPDGQRVLTVMGDAGLWDLSGKLIATFGDSAISAQFVHDGQAVFTASGDGEIALWNLSGKLLSSAQLKGKGISGAQLSPDGQRVLAIARNRDGMVVTKLSGELISVIGGGPLFSAVFSPDGSQVLSASADGTADIWTPQGMIVARPSVTFQGHSAGLIAAIFSPDGTRVLTASDDNTVRIWSRSGAQIGTLRGDLGAPMGVAMSQDGRRVLIPSRNGTIRIWDLTNQEPTFRGHSSGVASAVFSPDGQRILTASGDGTARLWDTKRQPLVMFKGHTDVVRQAVFSPDGQRVLTASYDGTARLWDLSGKTLATFKGHTDAVYTVAFSPDSQQVLTGSGDGTARLWDLSGKLLATFKGHTDAVYTVAFSPDSQQVLTGSGDGTARLWDLSGKLLATLKSPGKEHGAVVNSVAFSPDSKRILISLDDGTGQLWDLSGKTLAVFTPFNNDPDNQTYDASPGTGYDFPAPEGGEKPPMFSAVFSPDGQRILTASADGTARVWNISGQTLLILRGHTGRVFSAVFSPDGQRILTASADGTARLHGTVEDLLVMAACRSKRNLNDEELARFAVDQRRFDIQQEPCPPDL